MAVRNWRTHLGCVVPCAAAVVVMLLMTGGGARAEAVVALYSAYWAGLPAAQIRLKLAADGSGYDDEIVIQSEGLPRLVTHFRGDARAAGRLGAGRTADPARYDAVYDLRKRRHSHIGMRFVAHDGAIVAERSADDTSRKPPLAEEYRRNIVDPLTAFERIRSAIAARAATSAGAFTVPVYDGARRFDIKGRILPGEEQNRHELRVELNLRPIAGFKGESSDDGDPDNSPRPVALTLTDDPRLLPLSLTVRVFYLPLVVRLDRVCHDGETCSGADAAPVQRQ